ncbi:hypothetical protein NQ318_009399 [Aromia moschata]|uniref:Serpin domain-containing protein n=1 Tax=Aromia moschata TaxID=1265417 RepID=A0AAV8Z9I7_9CUCU|nr:hypothetical protein NQ318_009399 [Aromia moschata]
MRTFVWLPLLVALNIHATATLEVYRGVVPQKDYDEYGFALDAIFGVCIRLQAMLNQSTPRNFVVSPVSATVIVAQLLLGAEGEFKDHLYDLLSLPEYLQHRYSIKYPNKNNESSTLYHAKFHFHLSSLLKKLQKRKDGEEFTLNQSNALFYNEELTLNAYFKRFMKSFYNSEITPLNFSTDTTSTINDWCSNHTNGLIKNIVSAPPDESTSAIFLNSIYFLAEWETPFADVLNRVEPFHVTENHTVTTTYMQGIIPDVPYAKTSEYKLVCLPYLNYELGMYVLLPREDHPYKYDINKFFESLNPGEVLTTVTLAKIREATVKIPKLSLSNTLRLLEPLQKYAEYKKVKSQPKNDKDAIEFIEQRVKEFQNFTTPVKQEVYLTAAAEGEGLRVSDIVQQMVFSINEKGTEAAAVTAGITDYMGGSKVMVLDRPFTFFILHEATKAILFWGNIVDPSQT